MTDPILRLPAKSKILFQGDSITDMNRGRDNDPNHLLGHSYAFLIAARASASNPELGQIFVNRGVSGDRIANLAARWKTDALDLNPDVLSILVGINDILAGTSIVDFERDYDALLSETKRKLPKVQLVVCEPFGLATGWRKDTWPESATRLRAMQKVVRELARKHKTIFVPLQSVFEGAAKRAAPDYWIWDSIHPTYAGQQLIADEWLSVANKQFKRT
ncbi:MAG TPA: SGNH/GDSL hydrolase family protein [Fimbriimonas sp.]|nr:SGNH/GDSL hydrolase family protein [Fimbriimonas sp.]